MLIILHYILICVIDKYMESVLNWQFESQFTNCSQANFKVFFEPCLYITNISIHNKKKVLNILI